MSTLSVIIPVCSTQGDLEKCVDSLVNQTYKDLEILLVSDKSTTLCNTLASKDERIKVIPADKCGISSARNAGLDAAKGSHIVFACADSIFEATSLEKCMQQIHLHAPDLLVCAVEAAADDPRSKIYMDTNMYTRSEYTENISRYISTGIGFDTVANKVFSADIIRRFNMRFCTDMPLVAQQLFNCRYFALAGHIRCISDLLCRHAHSTAAIEGTTEYLAQGKEYSQRLINAVQSKGLYGAAAQAIGENYQKILYRHLVLLAAPGESLTNQQRTEAIEQLSKSGDSAPLMLYLATLPGIKNRYIYEMYKLRQWRLLLSFLGR